VLPLYLDTQLDDEQREAMTAPATDSVQVSFVSRIQAERFSPFGPKYEQDRNGMLGVRIPIQKVLGALVEDYANHRFERLHGVTRRTLDSLNPPSVASMTDPGGGEGVVPSGVLHLQISLIDFRVKEHAPTGTGDFRGDLAAQDDGAGMNTRGGATTGEGERVQGLVRGARMIVEVAIRRKGPVQSVGLHASVEQRFERRTSARWTPVVNALNDRILAKIDRYLQAQGM
jgi:hypothetical protein